MRVLVGGSAGRIGSALCSALEGAGHEPVRLVRRAPRAGSDGREIAWDPARGVLDPGALLGAGAVVHLGGASIADGRWTPARRDVLLTSRVGSTALLARALAGMPGAGPRVLVTASAIGFYGDRGEEALDEASAPGAGFLADLCRAWEQAAAPAAVAGVRVASMRIGLVLDAGGGALAAMLPMARLGLSGPLGGGRQWWSWITCEDLVRALVFVLDHDALRGPVNAVAPSPVRQAGFARALGAVLGRPAFLPAPAFALRAALGRERADELLLASQRVRPAALDAAGFAFLDREIGPALARLLGRPGGA